MSRCVVKKYFGRINLLEIAKFRTAIPEVKLEV